MMPWAEVSVALGSEVCREAEPDVASVLARGLETPLVPEVEEAVCVAVPEPAVPEAEAEAEADEPVSEAAMNGLELLPPVPCVKSRLKPFIESCCWMLAETLSLFSALPLREA